MSVLKKKIINFGTEIFGIDLSDLSVKVVQLEREGDVEKIRSYNSVDIEPGDIDNGKIINKEKVVAAIREAVKKSGPKKISTKKVICSIPESKAFLRIISIPKMEEREANEAIKWEMEANIPLSIDQVYFDWQFLDFGGEKKQDVLTVAVSKEIVDDLMEVLERAGLSAYGLEVESVASVRSLINEKDCHGKAFLIVDMGAQRTSFIAVAEGVPYFTSSIPFSSENLNDAIAKKMNLSEEEAETTKLLYGVESHNNTNPVFGAVGSLLENLSQEIEKTLIFYKEMHKGKAEIESVILCGGGSNLKGLIPYLAKKLGKKVEMGNPWVNINFGKKLPLIEKENSIRYTTAIGLALRGLDYEN